MKVRCIVPKCVSNEDSKLFVTFPFPKITYNKYDPSQPNLVSIRRFTAWKEACKLSDDFETHIEGAEARVCSKHFVSGKPAKKMDMYDVDWVPSRCLNGEEFIEEDSSKLKIFSSNESIY